MSPFNTSKYRTLNKTKAGGKPPPDIFSRSGGKMGRRRLNRHISRLPLKPHQREYAKRVMEKFDHHGSRGVTPEEFRRGLDEMADNQRDPITSKDIETIKKHF